MAVRKGQAILIVDISKLLKCKNNNKRLRMARLSAPCTEIFNVNIFFKNESGGNARNIKVVVKFMINSDCTQRTAS